MSDIGVKVDIKLEGAECPLMTQYLHSRQLIKFHSPDDKFLNFNGEKDHQTSNENP